VSGGEVNEWCAWRSRDVGPIEPLAAARGGLLRWGGGGAIDGRTLLTAPGAVVECGVAAIGVWALGEWARELNCDIELATMVLSSSTLSGLCTAGEPDGDADAPGVRSTLTAAGLANAIAATRGERVDCDSARSPASSCAAIAGGERALAAGVCRADGL
jgi:hypothetical protein